MRALSAHTVSSTIAMHHPSRDRRCVRAKHGECLQPHRIDHLYRFVCGRWTCSLAFATNRIDRYVCACVGYLLVFSLLWKHSARIRNIIDIYRANDRARIFSCRSRRIRCHRLPSMASMVRAMNFQGTLSNAIFGHTPNVIIYSPCSS